MAEVTFPAVITVSFLKTNRIFHIGMTRSDSALFVGRYHVFHTPVVEFREIFG